MNKTKSAVLLAVLSLAFLLALLLSCCNPFPAAAADVDEDYSDSSGSDQVVVPDPIDYFEFPQKTPRPRCSCSKISGQAIPPNTHLSLIWSERLEIPADARARLR